MSEELEVGGMIRFHRKIARLSREGLAKLAGVGKTVVFDIEQGKKSVKFSTLLKLLTALNIHIQLNGPLMHLFRKERDEKS